MKNNAIKFNGSNNIISNEATKIYEFVKTTIEANRDELKSIELAVEDQFNSGNRKRATSSTPRDNESVGDAEGILLDGIYLGPLQDPFGDTI